MLLCITFSLIIDISPYIYHVLHIIMQIVLGLPEPREFSFLSHLKLVESGMQNAEDANLHDAQLERGCLPITNPSILD